MCFYQYNPVRIISKYNNALLWQHTHLIYASDVLSVTSDVSLTTKQNSNSIKTVNVHTSLVQLEAITLDNEPYVLKFRTCSSSVTAWMNILECI